MANIKARRKLADLYKRGVELRFGVSDSGPYHKVGPFVDDKGDAVPPSEEEIAVWIQPPSPLQREQALRDAQASRARALLRAKRDEDSEEHLTAMAFLVDMDDETLIDYVLISETDARRGDAVREVLSLKEWEDITSYQDLARQFDDLSEEEREASEDYKTFLELDKKFGNQVQERERELREAAYGALKILGREAVERKALEKRSELIGSQAFMAEYERQMMFYSVRDIEDHGVLFYESARELAEQEDEIKEAISEALEPFISDIGEAKNSPRAALGSTQSEPPSEPETSGASTQETVNA